MTTNNYQSPLHNVQDTSAVDDAETRAGREVMVQQDEVVVADQAGRELVVEIRDLTKTYKLGQTRVRALRGVSLEVRRGGFVAIMGPSGSGKSSLMNLVGCLDRATSGEYRLMGSALGGVPASVLDYVRNS